MISPSRSATRGRRSARAILPALLLAALAGGCEKVALVAPTSSTITLTVSSDTLALGGATTISAMVIESGGTPVHNGTLVVFTTNLGRLDPPDATTVNGKATTTLLAGSVSGTATVGAMSGSAAAEALEVVIGGAAAEQVLVSVSPGTVPATGGTVTVTATVLDGAGNPLEGVPVNFGVDFGSLDAGRAITNEGGQAQVRLTTNRETNITVAAGAQSATARVTVSAAPTVSVTAPSTTLFTGQAIQFNVNATAGTNSYPLLNVTLDFGDGTSASLGPISGQTTVSHIYSRPGTYTVSATARDAGGQESTTSTIIVVLERPGLQVAITGSTNPTVNVATVYSVSVTSPAGTPAVTRVAWDWGDGGQTVTTSLSTSHVFTSAGRKIIRVTVTAADGSTGTAQYEVVVGAGAQG